MADSELILATTNTGKVDEIRTMLPQGFSLLSLKDAGISFDLPETTGTIPGNALQKAQTVYRHTGRNCIADDTGLIVPSLNGAPGVDSAFYAGLPRSDERNMEKLLHELTDRSREASFLCVIALIFEGEKYLFEGELHGKIGLRPEGANGFGYDPVFIPQNEVRTLAEMNKTEKNQISHRGIAIRKLISFLESKI